MYKIHSIVIVLWHVKLGTIWMYMICGSVLQFLSEKLWKSLSATWNLLASTLSVSWLHLFAVCCLPVSKIYPSSKLSSRPPCLDRLSTKLDEPYLHIYTYMCFKVFVLQKGLHYIGAIRYFSVCVCVFAELPDLQWLWGQDTWQRAQLTLAPQLLCVWQLLPAAKQRPVLPSMWQGVPTLSKQEHDGSLFLLQEVSVEVLLVCQAEQFFFFFFWCPVVCIMLQSCGDGYPC